MLPSQDLNASRYFITACRKMFIRALLIIFVHSSLALQPAVVQLTKPVDHAEGPVWDSRTELLYFVDIHSGKFNSYDIKTKEHQSVSLDGELTVAIPSQQDAFLFLVGLNRSVVAIQWDGKNELEFNKVLTTVDVDKPSNRFNDGKADKEGRLWFGTMGYEDSNGVLDNNQGSLYFITQENLINPKAVITPVNISNGMAWNRANDKFYYIDTPTNQVREYDYDNDSGAISNPRVVFDVNDHSQNISGHPDGMTIDIEDNLWVALYDGGAVVKVNPTERRLLEVVQIPAQYVTSVCWGGPTYDILFVTTSRYVLSQEEREKQPEAGSVFAIEDLGTHGLPSFLANIVNVTDCNCKDPLI